MQNKETLDEILAKIDEALPKIHAKAQRSGTRRYLKKSINGSGAACPAPPPPPPSSAPEPARKKPPSSKIVLPKKTRMAFQVMSERSLLDSDDRLDEEGLDDEELLKHLRKIKD